LVLNLGMMAKEKELKGANSLAMILVNAFQVLEIKKNKKYLGCKEKELKGANSLAMILVTASCTKKTLMKNEQVLCVRLFCICFPGTKKIKKN